jgi:hypothetical protein
MKSYRDILTELFDTKVRLNVTADTSYAFSAFFYVPAEKSDNIFEFQFIANKASNTLSFGDDVDEPWELLFLRIGGPGGGSGIGLFNDLTAKETLSVFSGVKSAMMKWYKSQKPTYFAFVAKSTETTRVKLYDKFAKIIAAKLKLTMNSGFLKSNKRYIFTKK